MLAVHIKNLPPSSTVQRAEVTLIAHRESSRGLNPAFFNCKRTQQRVTQPMTVRDWAETRARRFYMQTVQSIEGRTLVVDVLGPTVEFLTPPSEEVYCVLKGSIPPGMSVPLHSHPEPESFLVVSGSGQVLTERNARLEWLDVKPGDFIHIAGGTKHAHRNTSSEPLVELATTGATLGQFFHEIGRPTRPGLSLPPPTAEDLDRFQRMGVKVRPLDGQSGGKCGRRPQYVLARIDR